MEATMTSPVSAATTAPNQHQQPGDPAFDKALADAQPGDKPFSPSADQLAQMAIGVMSPIVMTHVQETMGQALGGED
jgi:hypothetical protein